MKRTEQGLRSVRVRRGMTQEALEAAAGVQQETISRLEREGPSKGVIQAIRLARAVGATVEDIFGTFADADTETDVHTQPRKRVATG